MKIILITEEWFLKLLIHFYFVYFIENFNASDAGSASSGEQ